MEPSDRLSEVKAFDDAKMGVKGLMDSGITEIPAMFHAPPDILRSLKQTSPPEELKIPTIDLKGGRVDLVEKIGEAAEKWGLFQVVNHGIPVAVLERMMEGYRKFHEQDAEAKKPFYSRDHSRDVVYYSNFNLLFNTEAASWRDTVGCYTAPDPPGLQDLPAVCGEIMMEYSKEMMKLGEFIFELLSEALGLNSNYLKDLDCAKSQYLVGQYYPPCPQPDLTLGIGKHTDISFITILHQDNIGGLQLLHDQYWIDVSPLPGAIVVNIGDFLQLITNDKFKSAEHRVIANKSSQSRLSVVCFFSTFMKAYSRVYGPIKSLLSEENPAKYRDFTLTEFATIFKSKTIGTPVSHYFKI